MPLLKNGAKVENTWTYIETEQTIPATGCVTVNLSRLIQDPETVLSRNTQVGIRLFPDDDPADLLDFIDRIALIEVSFPKYTDGRGYSQAQLLRRRYGYKGELRAVGHVLRDQILYMDRSGFDAFETTRANLSDIVEALNEYSDFYQPAAGGNKSVFARRHEKA